MGSILENYDPLLRLLLQSLINSLWQGALILALVLGLLRIVGGRVSATTRHAIWFVSLLTIAVLPFLPASLRRSSLPVASPIISNSQERGALSGQNSAAALTEKDSRPVLNRSARQAEAGAASDLAPSGAPEVKMTDALPANSSPAQAQEGGLIYRWSVIVFGGQLPLVLMSLWAIGCAFMSYRIIRSYLFLFRLSCDLLPLSHLQEQQMNKLAASFAIKRQVRIFASDKTSTPMTIGFVRPLIVLPRELTATLSQPELASILAHELAHIKRWDYLTNLLQHLIQAFLFFHPAIWIIGKQLVIERELACDDWAVKMTGEPRCYASCLTKLAELLRGNRSLAVATGMLLGKLMLSRRIEMILNTNRNSTVFISKPAMIYALGVAVLSISICSCVSPVIAVPIVEDNISIASYQEKSDADSAQTAVVIAKAVERGTQRHTPPAPEPPLPLSPQAAPLPPAPAEAPAPEEPQEPSEHPLMHPLPEPVVIVPVTYWGQQAQQATPGKTTGSENSSNASIISEAELLAVLTDIVKQDADPTVRNEALQGIYRFRTDAGVNSLIQIYDAVTDVKIKGEIIGYLLRRKGDNSKAIAKLVAIAKTEKEEDLRSRALSQLFKLSGDDGTNSLIEVYDSVQDPKTKQRVIYYLASTKNRKAVDKLIKIAKSDPDPQIRQSAIRTLYNIDSRMYLELFENELRAPLRRATSLNEPAPIMYHFVNSAPVQYPAVTAAPANAAPTSQADPRRK